MKTTAKRSFLKRNGLSIVLLVLMVIFLFGQYITGYRVYNNELNEDGFSSISLLQYLISGHFLQATFENWESEFLQMAIYVLLTIKLFQIGSAESKDPDKEEKVDQIIKPKENSPWPVKQGGVWLKLYSHSLSIAFTLLFLTSFVFHFIGSLINYNEEQVRKGQAEVDWKNHLPSSQFWFESFQNWQSEFLAVASIVILSVFLRQKGSPESKPVDSPNSETGT